MAHGSIKIEIDVGDAIQLVCSNCYSFFHIADNAKKPGMEMTVTIRLNDQTRTDSATSAVTTSVTVPQTPPNKTTLPKTGSVTEPESREFSFGFLVISFYISQNMSAHNKDRKEKKHKLKH